LRLLARGYLVEGERALVPDDLNHGVQSVLVQAGLQERMRAKQSGSNGDRQQK
jgi:hypothetical protein